MAGNTMTERKYFLISEFDDEAAWLSFMHKSGWKMVRTTGFKYRFESCPQEDWLYQLDYRDEAMDEEAYIQMYADYGWEFVTRFRNWYYFRKIRRVGEDLSIFSDNESKIEMCSRIIRRHALILAVYYLFIFAAFAFMKSGACFAESGSFLDGFFNGGATGLVLGGFIGLYFVARQFFRLRQKIQYMKNPLK